MVTDTITEFFTNIYTHFEKEKSERQLCGRKCLVDVRGQRRMGKLDSDDRKATISQITTRYSQGMHNTTPGAAPVS